MAVVLSTTELELVNWHSNTAHQEDQLTYQIVNNEINDNREEVYQGLDRNESANLQSANTAQQNDYSQVMRRNGDTNNTSVEHDNNFVLVNEQAAHAYVQLSENGRYVVASDAHSTHSRVNVLVAGGGAVVVLIVCIAAVSSIGMNRNGDGNSQTMTDDTVMATTFYNSSKTTARPMTSALFTRDLQVHQLTTGWMQDSVTALSLSANGQWLLVGHQDDHQLHVYTIDGSHVKTINMSSKDRLYDAVWTPHNNSIVYTTLHGDRVLTMSVTGDIIASTKIVNPKYLSVSSDGVIYLASLRSVWQCTDNGLTWIIVFSFPRDVNSVHAIKLSTTEFMTIECVHVYNYSSRNENWSMRVYTISDRYSNGILTCRSLNLPQNLSLVKARLVYDGHTNVYVTDWDNRAVHVWSVDGRYNRQLLSSPRRITSVEVDKQSHVMYVGQTDGIVSAYSLQ